MPNSIMPDDDFPFEVPGGLDDFLEEDDSTFDTGNMPDDESEEEYSPVEEITEDMSTEEVLLTQMHGLVTVVGHMATVQASQRKLIGALISQQDQGMRESLEAAYYLNILQGTGSEALATDEADHLQSDVEAGEIIADMFASFDALFDDLNSDNDSDQ